MQLCCGVGDISGTANMTAGHQQVNNQQQGLRLLPWQQAWAPVCKQAAAAAWASRAELQQITYAQADGAAYRISCWCIMLQLLFKIKG